MPNQASVPFLVPRARLGRLISYVLVGLGALFLLASATYAANAVLKSWLIGQDRFLMAQDVAPLPVVTVKWMVEPDETVTTRSTLVATATRTPASATESIPTPGSVPGSTTAGSAAPAITAPGSSNAPSPVPSVTPLPSATAAPSPSPSVQSAPKPVKIRIPSLDVSRSIIPMTRSRDRRTGAMTWNTKTLFRSGRKDLVGHSEGSANPGEAGNMILVGHNYGYGFNGVFVRLNRLKPGGKVYVVNSAGQTFTYKVKTVEKVKWRRKNFGELTQHLSFLSSGGSERLTLVSCSGADVEPFPERIYVVAEPVE